MAEIGWNFLGFKIAKKMILSKKSGASEFQIWDPKFLKKGPWDIDGGKIYEKAFLDQKNI